MVLNDTLAAALSKITNAEIKGQNKCTIKPVSKMIKKVLSILKEHNYIGEFKEIEDGSGGYLEVELIGNVNKCFAIKPRFNFKIKESVMWEKRYLPSRNIGIIIVSTSNGLITHTQAKEKGTGGCLVAYCY